MVPAAKSRRPYLIRAIHQWTLDNGYTPYLLVAADEPGVVVPRQFVKEGRIALDISAMAVRDLNLESEPIFFSARFGGRAMEVLVPSGAVLAIYARENGEGIVFGEPEASDAAADGSEPSPEPPKPSGRPKLRIVK